MKATTEFELHGTLERKTEIWAEPELASRLAGTVAVSEPGENVVISGVMLPAVQFTMSPDWTPGEETVSVALLAPVTKKEGATLLTVGQTGAAMASEALAVTRAMQYFQLEMRVLL